MNHLHNAIRKCSWEYKRRYSGYLLPKEILALRDFGVILDDRDIELAIYWKRSGYCAGRWTFFDLDKTIEESFKETKRGLFG